MKSKPVWIIINKLIIAIITIEIISSCGKGNPVNGPSRNSIIENAVTDVDGNSYSAIQIGDQVWTVENLRTTKYNDGSAMLHNISWSAWDSCYYKKSGAYCFNNNSTNTDTITKYGALYNWYAVSSNKLAPKGWHVPSYNEWIKLQDYLIANGFNYDGTTEGNKIGKSMAAATDWKTTDGAGKNYSTPGEVGYDLSKNNSSGFSALPGGYCIGGFSGTGDQGWWWNSTAIDNSYAWCCYLWSGNWTFRTNTKNEKISGCSVRLVRD
jgi:uncharacterized protein (TIGR02145 family)